MITEVDPLRALEAVMDGYRVMPMLRAAEIADIFVTATGDINVLDKRHFERINDGVDPRQFGALQRGNQRCGSRSDGNGSPLASRNVRQYVLPDGRRINLIAEGRLVNLSAARATRAR